VKLSYHKLRAHLGRGELAPVYVVAGEQDLLRELAVGEIVEHGLGAEATPFNFERFDGEVAEAESVVLSANQLPMLGGGHVVVVRRAQKLLEKAGVLVDYLDDPSPRTVLVLELSKTPDKRRKTWKALEKKTQVVSCETPPTSELEDWVEEQVKARKLRLDIPAIKYLVAEFGGDLRRLLNEIEKLSLYAGEEKLDLETIATLLGRGKAQSIFKFVDAVGAGQAAKALRQLGRLLEEGEPPLRILALVDRLVGQLRVAHELQSARQRGGGGSLARVLGVPPYAAKSLGDAARRFDGASLERALRSLSETDRTLKSSAVPARLLLESLVISLCGGGGRASSRRVR